MRHADALPGMKIAHVELLGREIKKRKGRPVAPAVV
jgi:hypothetical protein